MPGPDDMIKGLRDALRVSPDNAALRKVLIETLISFSFHDQAASELRDAMRATPQDATLKLLLAKVYVQQAAWSKATVVLEDLLATAPTPAARVLFAKVLLRTNEPARARHQYRQALEDDPSAAVPELSEELGISTPAPDEDDDDSPAFERLAADGGSKNDDNPDVELENPTATFADVGGMDAVKEDIRLKIIYPMQRPDLYKVYGKSAGGGILLYGPPGCGKTHIARATAGEVRAKFLAIGISDVLTMWMGESEKNLTALFDQARRNRPCVLFFDEVDALAGNRNDLRQSGARQVVNQFLSELDGIGKDNQGLLILAATNAPWHLDGAFRRPGRFDRIVFIPPPDAPARAQILRLMLQGKPTEDIDVEAIARKTDDFSGADLKALVDSAVEAKLHEAMKSAASTPKPLRTRDLLDAAKTLRPTTREWFASARNHALYANQHGLYDPILAHLGLKKP